MGRQEPTSQMHYYKNQGAILKNSIAIEKNKQFWYVFFTEKDFN